MSEQDDRRIPSPPPDRIPRRVRLPRIVTDDDIGLGDVVKRVTTAVGVRPCMGCAKRAEALNRRLVFHSRRSKSN
jgi:hypothetical protein